MRFCAKERGSFSESTADIGKEESHVKTIDHYSFHCGVIDCFNEMVSAGVKRLAFSEPVDSAEECRSYQFFVEKTCHKYGTRFYFEPSSLVTDLFPKELNAGRVHYVFYREDDALREYLATVRKRRSLPQRELTVASSAARLHIVSAVCFLIQMRQLHAGWPKIKAESRCRFVKHVLYSYSL